MGYSIQLLALAFNVGLMAQVSPNFQLAAQSAHQVALFSLGLFRAEQLRHAISQQYAYVHYETLSRQNHPAWPLGSRTRIEHLAL